MHSTTTDKYKKLMAYISNFQLKIVRFIMVNMRRDSSMDLFFPMYGCTAGEFACGYTLKKISAQKR